MRGGWSSVSGRIWGCAICRVGSGRITGRWARCGGGTGRALNDVFTQVVEIARELGLGRLGTVAIDSTRIRACASRDGIDTEQRLRNERAKIRRWKKCCDGSDPEEGAGVRVAVENLERRLADIPQRLERLRKSGQAKLSRRDGEARFLRERGGYALGYTAEIAVSEDHLIVAQRVTLNPCDVPALVPLVKEVEERTVASPEKALADAGFYSNQNVRELEARGIDVYVPDPNLARELNTGKRARTIGRNRVRSPELKAMRKNCAAGRDGECTNAARRWWNRCLACSSNSVGCGNFAPGDQPRWRRSLPWQP